ncbi:response regulator [Propionivibrio sp.]|jgi:CheY-like chemotaxis protein|uniref:response regulator n=1 Tax=Propionivibrio sp. TaxID=2212460 RepID=UPI00272DEB59|nr:response regulator [Propionivibrio sp.]
MRESFRVFVVDDDPLVLEIITTILEPDCHIRTFDSAEACWEAMDSIRPDLFFLDVSLPGMDGFTLCRNIKTKPEHRQTPVIFVSAHDTIEERIRGYDAGGEDFIVKPFEPEELLRKLKVAQNIVLSQRSLAEQVREAEQLSSLVMASMDETGILLQFMSKLIAMDSQREIADELLELLRRYRLDGVVQTRAGDQALTVSAAGVDLPLEVAIIEHVRKQGRIFEFSRRSVHNFERVTLMINNLPLEDPDYCGRLRDHLSVAAQGVDSRLKAMQDEQGIQSALTSVNNTLRELRDAHQRNAADSTLLINALQDTLLNSFYKLGLTDNQERFLQNMVSDFMARMAELLNRGLHTQETLQRLNDRLEQLRSC